MIGMFDSGSGGLSVLREVVKLLPGERYVYYSDNAHCPYGEKTAAYIQDRAREITRLLMAKGCNLIVVACNTATGAAIKQLREEFPIPFIGMEPAVKPAVEVTDKKRIMVIATPVTIREDKLKDLLHRVDEEHRVDLLAMPRLVEFAEREEFDSEDVHKYIEEQFSAFDKDKYCALVLGCTHFNYFKPEYRRYFGDDTLLIDGNYGTIHHLADVLGLNMSSDQDKVIYFEDYHNMLCQCNTDFYFSGKKVEDPKTLEHICRLHNRLELVRKN